MKTCTQRWAAGAAAGVLFLTGGLVSAGDPLGTFVQLSRASGDKTREQWAADFEQMAAAGIKRIVVQWVADDQVAYFGGFRECAETLPVLERMFEAMEGRGFDVYLGLGHDPNYWTAITGREKTVRDYFRLRQARNLRIQKALIAAFGNQKAWVGYYLPDEIDDKSWRSEGRGRLMRTYLEAMAASLKERDTTRKVAVSAFFRGRTAPEVFAGTLRDLVRETGIDEVLVQDGAGESDPPIQYVGRYYQALKRTSDDKMPRLACIVEAFRRVAETNGTFVARPAPAESLKQQLNEARQYFNQVLVFSFLDYTDPDLGADGAAAYRALMAP